MPPECPNCRHPVPRLRLFLTTAWGRFPCKGCGSLLGVDVGRRMLMVMPCLLMPVLGVVLPRFGVSGTVISSLLVPAVLVGFAALLFFFDRAVVHELRGSRCQGCGYDLQGQVEARCPECGLAFDPALARQQSTHASAPTSRRKAVVTFVFLVLSALLLLGVFAGTYVWRRNSQRNVRVAVAETDRMVQALLGYAAQNGGRGPKHAITLAADGAVNATHFVAWNSYTSPQSTPFGNTTPILFEQMSPEARADAAQAAAGALPEGTIAHRLGDFVFTYHGIDFSSADPNLWVVIWLPDPPQNPPLAIDDTIVIGQAGGDAERVGIKEFAERESKQNLLRKEAGLPRLTSVFAVTHGKPMVSNSP